MSERPAPYAIPCRTCGAEREEECIQVRPRDRGFGLTAYRGQAKSYQDHPHESRIRDAETFHEQLHRARKYLDQRARER